MKYSAALLTNLVVLLFAAAMITQSCTGPTVEVKNENETVFDHILVKKVYSLENSSTDFETDSDLSFGCRVSLFIPVKFMGLDMSALRDSVLMISFDTIAGNPELAAESCFINSGVYSGYPLVEKDTAGNETDSVDTTFDSLNNFNGFMEIQGRIAAMTPDYISYSVTSSTYYPMAAHGMYGTRYIVYSTKAEKVVSLADFFTPAGLEALPALLRKKAYSMRGFIGSTNLTEIPAYGNFYINTDGDLVFVYQPYEIASFAQGEISITIEPYLVSDYLNALGKQVLLSE